jgi:hypothetical protein
MQQLAGDRVTLDITRQYHARILLSFDSQSDQLPTDLRERALGVKFNGLNVKRLYPTAIYDERHQALCPELLDLFARNRAGLSGKFDLIHLVYSSQEM